MITTKDRRKLFDRRQESAALKNSEEQYRRLFETAQDGIIIIKARTGEITDVNPYLLNILGYSPAEIIGEIIWQLDVFKDTEAGREAISRLQTQGLVRYENLPLQAKDGRKIDVELISNVYEVQSEKVIQYNIRDITRRKKAEEEREMLIGKLKDALANIKKLSGLIPICASCKNIRDDEGYWQKLEQYISEHSEANFTHGICPECMAKLYPKHHGSTGILSAENDRSSALSADAV